MKYKMTISYDGNYFKGSQRQRNLKTVQGEIENVLSKINEKKVDVTFCGRTDAGVHAKSSVTHFELEKKVKVYNLRKLLNRSLNNEIFILSIEEVDDKFHARYDCIKKEYKYFINVGEYNLFYKDHIYQYNQELNIKSMRKALKFLEGEHDFRSFCSDDKEQINCIRKIMKTKISKEGNIIEISIVGNGFLKHMVRNIVGYLIEIGCGNKSFYYMKDVLNKKSREKGIKPAPSCGLYLWEVKYK